MDDVKSLIREKQQEIENLLYRMLPPEEGLHKTIFEAMNYSIKVGGKRLRPMLMLETYRLFGGREKVIEPFMMAIEMIHTYSLVHDDLPSMDNDRLRRGKETTWVVYGDGMATLAGDALLNGAFEVAAGAFDLETDPKRIAKALQILAAKAGANGMIGGQVVDIESEGRAIDLDTIRFIHRLKTCALIEASMMIGAVLAGANEDQIAVVEEAAREIGMAFQIQDDILDVIGDELELGKPIGSDEENQKTTYVTLLGLEPAQEEVALRSRHASELLQSLEGDSTFLTKLVASLVKRNR